MDKVVAIKMLHAHLVTNPQSLMRFQQEAQAASALSHPNVIAVHDFGITPQGMPYLVMDYLEGTSLTDLIATEGNLPPERTCNIFIQACDALSHAHQKGIIHRDIKPSNIMLLDKDDNPDFVLIVDFGIAKLLPQSEKQGQHLTQTGEVFGSPLYMSPEQCLAGKLDHRADIYSLGCVIYEALTGSSPLSGASMIETMYLHLNEPALPFRKVRPDLSIPEALEAVVFKAMEKDPSARQQSMSALQDDLDNVRCGRAGHASWFNKATELLFRHKRQRQLKLSRWQIVFISSGALVTGAVLMLALVSTSTAPPGAANYSESSLWISYAEKQCEPLTTVEAADREGKFKFWRRMTELKYGRNDPRVGRAYFLLASLYRNQHRYPEALECYKKTYDLMRSGVEIPRVSFIELEKGLMEMYRLQGNYVMARQMVRGCPGRR